MIGWIAVIIGVTYLVIAMWQPHAVGFRYCTQHRWVWCVTRHGIRKDCPLCDRQVRDRP